jgi:2,5-dihydroxypyridine 5,6-dioxygenase
VVLSGHDAEIRRRSLAGAQRTEAAREVRITSRAGTDLTMRKDGRIGAYQCSVADKPGRWDHWPTGMVYCAPLEDSAEGVLVVQPGDVLPTSLQHARSEVRLTFRQGKVQNVTGGPEATQIEAMLRAAGDDGAYRLAHAGWGTDPRADWRVVGMDSESLSGAVTVALGRNIFSSPAPHCGLGGVNRSRLHYDMCMLGTSLYLDGELVVDEGRLAVEGL